MCGIAGFSLSKRTQRVDTDALARALLLGIEERGRDASGVAWSVDETNDAETNVWIQKDALKASQLAPHVSVPGARALIAHTRAATKGATSNNKNNHPVEHHGIVGVHNGVLYNDDEIFDLLNAPRYGQVDTEAAFALIARGAEDLDADVEELLPIIEGSAALAWLDVNDEPGVLHLARVASSPLVVGQTRLGSLIFASTRKAMNEAAMHAGFRVKYVNELPEGSYLRVKDGIITDVRRFAPPKRKGYVPTPRTIKAQKNSTKAKLIGNTVALADYADDTSWITYRNEYGAADWK